MGNGRRSIFFIKVMRMDRPKLAFSASLLSAEGEISPAMRRKGLF